jgi:hypothetical protein
LNRVGYDSPNHTFHSFRYVREVFAEISKTVSFHVAFRFSDQNIVNPAVEFFIAGESELIISDLSVTFTLHGGNPAPRRIRHFPPPETALLTSFTFTCNNIDHDAAEGELPQPLVMTAYGVFKALKAYAPHFPHDSTVKGRKKLN